LYIPSYGDFAKLGQVSNEFGKQKRSVAIVVKQVDLEFLQLSQLVDIWEYAIQVKLAFETNVAALNRASGERCQLLRDNTSSSLWNVSEVDMLAQRPHVFRHSLACCSKSAIMDSQ
jgi:hypothetical protein